MKRLITLFALITSLHSIGQDCDKYISTITDKMTGKSSTGSKKVLVISKDGKTGLAFEFILSKDNVVMIIDVYGAGNCVDKDDETNILFIDGTRIEFGNDKKFNCKGRHMIFFGGSFGKEEILKQLTTKKIETARSWTVNKYMQMDFSDEQAIQFMNTIKCLADKL